MIYEKTIKPISRIRIGTIRNRILIAFVLVVSLPVIVITYASIIVNLRWGYGQVINQLESVATLKEAEIDNWVHGLQLDLSMELAGDTTRPLLTTLLRSSADTPNFQRAYVTLMNRFVQTITMKQRFEELFLMDLRGKVILSTRSSTEGEFRGLQAYFKEGLKNIGVHVQTLSFSSTSEGVNTVVFVHPVFDERGRAFGVLAGRAGLATLNNIMLERAGLNDTGETYLVGSNYVLLTDSRFSGYEPGKKYVNSDGVKAAFRDHVNGSGLYTGYRGVSVLGVHRWLPNLRVALLAEKDQSEALHPLYATLAINVVVTLATVLIAVMLSIFISGSIAKPIAGLARTAAQITAGNLELTAKVERDDEIGTLAQSFNNMTTQLRELIAGLEQRVAERKQAEEEIRTLNQELEQRVVDRTAQQEAAKKELEAFAYSVSHDMRAPVRHIDGFLELLQKRMSAVLDEQSQHYLSSISDSAKRVGTLIDDLLSFSRMGHQEMSKIQVDLGALVQEVIAEFKPEIHDRAIRWSIADLPVVIGDRSMLRIVLVNLISNALKFTRPRPQPEIEIGWKPSCENETTVFVRDNGVGFDMKYAGKLFGVFQRLHHADEAEGIGIGLANVRRIINRHGGKTWAEGQVGQGAVFYFSLPQLHQLGA